MAGPQWARLRAAWRPLGDRRDRTYDARRLNRDKLALIDLAFERYRATTFADLGGVWEVEGGYSFYAAGRHNARGLLVDSHPTPRVCELAQSQHLVSLVTGHFGDPAIAERVGVVDVVFFFDVLLHQVRPDWSDVLAMYASTAILLIYNPQWTGHRTVRLLELGEDEYFDNVPHDRSDGSYVELFDRLDEPHPDPDHGGRTWRDVHAVWQWGITDRDLISTCWDLGYRLEFLRNCGQFGTLPNFEYHALLLVRD